MARFVAHNSSVRCDWRRRSRPNGRINQDPGCKDDRYSKDSTIECDSSAAAATPSEGDPHFPSTYPPFPGQSRAPRSSADRLRCRRRRLRERTRAGFPNKRNGTLEISRRRRPSLARVRWASEHLHKFDLLRPKTRPPLPAAADRRGAAVRYLSLMPEAMYVTYDRAAAVSTRSCYDPAAKCRR